MRQIRAPRVIATAVTALLVGGGLAPNAANAVEFDAPRTILGSDCTKWLKWNGGLPRGRGHTPEPEPSGKVKLCWVKYKLRSNDDRADYYAISLQSTWTLREGDKRYPAEMHQATDSTRGAIDRVFGSTGSYTSSQDCTDPVTISFAVGPFGVSTTPRICDDYGISRYKSASDKSYWRSARAGGLRSIETAFVQKVRRGQVPKFDAVFAIPRYKVKYDEGAGYWRSKKHLKWISWTDR
jgi:hypothetical protein